MTRDLQRIGTLMDIAGYPAWIQRVIEECNASKQRVARHELYRRIKENQLSQPAMRNFLVGVWPVIWQFPQYMAMSLCRVEQGLRGHEEARAYLIKNIRIENKHAQLWAHWSEAHRVSMDDLLYGERPAAAEALSHWCWHTCERAPLAVTMAATNYAIEGVTGEWSCFICSTKTYEESFPLTVRQRALKWLKVHAEYDDTHPWEALEIIATILGASPSESDVRSVQAAICKSYDYMRLTLDDCLRSQGAPTVPFDQAAYIDHTVHYDASHIGTR
jgi:pyrroloquinoline quinone (PQQ) biosynthesis protein C